MLSIHYSMYFDRKKNIVLCTFWTSESIRLISAKADGSEVIGVIFTMPFRADTFEHAEWSIIHWTSKPWFRTSVRDETLSNGFCCCLKYWDGDTGIACSIVFNIWIRANCIKTSFRKMNHYYDSRMHWRPRLEWLMSNRRTR